MVFELGTASTAKPTASFEPAVNKAVPELAEQLIDTGPPKPHAELEAQVSEEAIATAGALRRAGLTIVAGTDLRLTSRAASITNRMKGLTIADWRFPIGQQPDQVGEFRLRICVVPAFRFLRAGPPLV